VFENIIDQEAVFQLRDDLQNNRCAPSMLFYGPAWTGKGSAALELARALSCQKDASWKCSCSSCERHRLLSHDDLLILGKRSFSCEIAACQSAFLRNSTNQTAKLLFYRSIKKLLMRFSPVLIEDDPKFQKISALLQTIGEKLDEFWALNETASGPENRQVSDAEKICAALIKDALILENDGLSSLIPVGHIRSTSGWCHLAPNGRHRILIIENADNMRDEARNSLLKLIEEPPSAVRIVLTSQRRDSLIPTILSRLRPYRFLNRSMEKEKEIIRRVFFDTEFIKTAQAQSSLINVYLDSFLAQNTDKLHRIAAWFIVSFARIVSIDIKKSGKEIPQFLNAIGLCYAQSAEQSGYGRLVKAADVIKTVSSNIDDDSFPRFMKICLELICDVMRKENKSDFIVYNEIFRKTMGAAVTSVDVLNINVTITLEGLFQKLASDIKRGMNG